MARGAVDGSVTGITCVSKNRGGFSPHPVFYGLAERVGVSIDRAWPVDVRSLNVL